MRTRGVSCHARGMDNRAALRLVLDLETEDDPVSGWLERPGGERERFEGLLGLLAALEAARVSCRDRSAAESRDPPAD